MKKFILAGAVAALLLTGVAAYAHPKHPNLVDAHELIVKAMGRIDDAQKDNPKGDLGGHAAKAKELLTQAEVEIKAAIEEADKTEAKSKK